MSTIVEFIEERLKDEAAAAESMPDPAKHRRIVDALAMMSVPIVEHLEARNLPPTDNPLAAGLLVIAQVWTEHPDFDAQRWFPRMTGQVK